MKYEIKDIERITGIKAYNIRTWEKRYELITPDRTNTNMRRYTDKDLKRLINLSLLLQNGFKISKLAKLSDAEINELVFTISESKSKFQTSIDNLTVSMIEFDEERFNALFNKFILKHGIDTTFFEILFPFMKKINLLWQSHSITRAQESFISNLIKKYIVLATDNEPVKAKAQQKTIALLSPETNNYEIYLLLYSYLLKKMGHKVIYLGYGIPLNNIPIVISTTKPDYVFISVDTNKVIEETTEFLNDFVPSHPYLDFFITGNGRDNLKTYEGISNIIKLENFNSLKDLSL